MSPGVEAVAALLLIVNIWLVAKRSLWNYAFGVAAVSVYALVFLEARLYAAFGLQFLFLALNLYGLVNWHRARGDAGDVPVGRMRRHEIWLTALVLPVAAVALAFLLARTTDAQSPLWDSTNTALALGAQYWQARRRVETWLLWIAVNLGSAGLYATQELWFTSATYALLLLIAIHGWQQWRAAERRPGLC